MRLIHVVYGLAVAAALAGAVIAAVAVFQRSLLYFPDATRYKPEDGNLANVREVVLETPDGAHLIAWYSPAAAGKPTFLYFHGNGGGLLGRAERFKLFQSAGYGLFMQSYRSFSGSTGSPSERALFADARLAYDHLRGQGLSPRDIVLYGESLGTGVAVHLAAEVEVAGLVLDAPYTSMVDMGKLSYPMLPVQTLLLDRFDSMSTIGQVHAPVLIMHGSNDSSIPVSMGKKLLAAAPEPKMMEVIPGAGHSNIFAFGALPKLRRFIDTYVNREKAGQGSGGR